MPQTHRKTAERPSARRASAYFGGSVMGLTALSLRERETWWTAVKAFSNRNMFGSFENAYAQVWSVENALQSLTTDRISSPTTSDPSACAGLPAEIADRRILPWASLANWKPTPASGGGRGGREGDCSLKLCTLAWLPYCTEIGVRAFCHFQDTNIMQMISEWRYG